jgi:hypothetical protein
MDGELLFGNKHLTHPPSIFLVIAVTHRNYFTYRNDFQLPTLPFYGVEKETKPNSL